MYNKEYHKKYREKNKKYYRDYAYAYHRGLELPTKEIRYGIYNLNGEYVFEGNLSEISEYSGKNMNSLCCSISLIKHGKRKNVIINGVRCEIVKMEE